MQKTKNILIVVLFVALAGSLYVQWNSQDDSGDNQTPQMSENDLFKKKQECASYRSDIETRLTEMNFENENVVTNNLLGEIWFSPSANTCMYGVNEFSQYKKERGISLQYSIYDYLGNDLVYNAMEVPGSVTRADALNAFNKRKEELQK